MVTVELAAGGLAYTDTADPRTGNSLRRRSRSLGLLPQ